MTAKRKHTREPYERGVHKYLRRADQPEIAPMQVSVAQRALEDAQQREMFAITFTRTGHLCPTSTDAGLFKWGENPEGTEHPWCRVAWFPSEAEAHQAVRQVRAGACSRPDWLLKRMKTPDGATAVTAVPVPAICSADFQVLPFPQALDAWTALYAKWALEHPEHRLDLPM